MRAALVTALLAASMASTGCGGEDPSETLPPPPTASGGAEQDAPALRDPVLGTGGDSEPGAPDDSAPAAPSAMKDGTIADIPLPDAPVAPEDASEGLRAAWASASAALELEPPPLPEDATAGGYGGWLENEWAEWFAHKWERVQRAIDRCERVVADGGPEATVAAALAGVMAAQTLQEVLGVPIPDDLASDARVTEAVHAGLLPRAEPILHVAQSSFRQCERLAGEALVEWRSFCKDHRRITEDEWRRVVGDHGVAAK